MSAPEVKIVDGPLPRLTGLATFDVDRCFKGTAASVIHVAADQYLPGGGWNGGGHVFTPNDGEYLLLFLIHKSEDTYKLADPLGALPVSAQVSNTPLAHNALRDLERDFKAGLNDPDSEVVLKSICWLGHMRHLRSTGPLRALLGTADPLQRGYLWEALLMVGDISVVKDVANYLDQNLPVSRNFVLPEDRQQLMDARDFMALCALRNRIVIPYLEHFADSYDPHIRVQTLMALREIGSLTSAPVFLRALDEPREDINFIAMQSLIELAGGGPIEWVPGYEDLIKAPEFYAAKCREWWSTEGEAKAKVATASVQKR